MEEKDLEKEKELQQKQEMYRHRMSRFSKGFKKFMG